MVWENAYRNSDRKPEKKRPLGTPTHRWVNNIKTNLKDWST
jgi:hypothetical protein